MTDLMISRAAVTQLLRAKAAALMDESKKQTAAGQPYLANAYGLASTLLLQLEQDVVALDASGKVKP